VPAAAPLAPALLPGFARLPRRVQLEGAPVDEKIIEACSYAMHRLGGPKLTRLGVTSSIRGEGRTSIAIALAFVQARHYGRSTLLVDADFDGPSLAAKLGLRSVPGLSEVVSGRARINDALQQVDERLTVLTAGQVGRIPSGLATELVSSRLQSSRTSSRLASGLVLSSLLSELQVGSEVIIADLPALIQSFSGVLLAKAFQDLVLVTRAGVTPIPTVLEAISALHTDPAVILNGTSSRIPGWLRSLFSWDDATLR
jgi:Mrp family chromosome partitioning ATPase